MGCADARCPLCPMSLKNETNMNRTKLDVYSPEVVVTRRARVLEPSHTRAVYQLRRLVWTARVSMVDFDRLRQVVDIEAYLYYLDWRTRRSFELNCLCFRFDIKFRARWPSR